MFTNITFLVHSVSEYYRCKCWICWKCKTGMVCALVNCPMLDCLLKGFKMKAYKHLVKFALKHGHTVSVYDGESWDVRRSTAYKAIIASIESVEIASLRIRNAAGDVIGWASVMPWLSKVPSSAAPLNMDRFDKPLPPSRCRVASCSLRGTGPVLSPSSELGVG